jgi:hypothetical protein
MPASVELYSTGAFIVRGAGTLLRRHKPNPDMIAS